METEIELKFFVSPDFSTHLQQIITGQKVLQHSRKTLENTYFDTPDHWLRQHDIGLRIRRFDDVFVQTTKTSGRVVAGLHQRPEYNAEHTGNVPDLSLHPKDIWPPGQALSKLQASLTPLFSTNFVREQWLIGMDDGSQIELAFDQGQVIAGEKDTPICEVELELRSGQTDALFSLARVLCESGGARLGNVSKAAQGYRLALGMSSGEAKELPLVPTIDSDSIETCFIKSIEHGLKHWQYHEQLYTEVQPTDALMQLRHGVIFIRQLLVTFASVVPRKASAVLRQELKWLQQELEWLGKRACIEDLSAEKGHALRKLDARKYLLSELKSQSCDLPSQEDMLTLLTSARYTRLLLDLSRWVLMRGWRPFLDEKSSAAIAKPVRDFSVVQLDRAWNELSEKFAPELSLSKLDYIEQQRLLNRNLYTGISFADLYDLEERNQYRLPWGDLLQGIEDLLALDPLERLVDQLEEEDASQLSKWLSRQETSILHAMEQTRNICLEARPYWQE